MGLSDSFPSATKHPAGFWEITVADLKSLPASVRRVDVRETAEFVGEMDILPNTEHAPLATVPDASSSWDKNEPIVIICRSGGRSGRAALWMQQQGFDNVVSLRGGMLDWNGLC